MTAPLSATALSASRTARQSAPPTKADEIAIVLEEAILSGEMEPGVVLRQEQLSTEFGVSRTPIREALQQLAALGLVSMAGGRGVQVRPPARDDLLETFTVRAALESYAAELARERMTKADLKELDLACERFAELTRKLRDPATPPVEMRLVASEWVRSNADFHDIFLDRAGVQRLSDAARSARRVFHGQAAWTHSDALSELYALNLEQHRQIANAFKAKDPRVRSLVEEHILDSARLLEQALDQAGYFGGNLSPLARRVSWAADRASH
jgi:DNA-binding GntR family transcriptional regulator